MIDDRTPVIVGAGQYNERESGSEPIDLMARCVEAALADAGAPALREAIRRCESCGACGRTPTLAASSPHASARPAVRTTLTVMGGNQVYDLVTTPPPGSSAASSTSPSSAPPRHSEPAAHDRAKGRSTEYVARAGGGGARRDFGDEKPMATRRPSGHSASTPP